MRALVEGSEAMARAGAEVIGIDLATDALAAAREHATAADVAVDYREIAAEDLAAEAPGAFDVVTCMEMLEHVPDPASVVSACRALLRPGGIVAWSTINRTPKAWLLAIVAAERLIGLLPIGTHSYDRLIRPAELAAWNRTAGLEVTAVAGVHYNPATRRSQLSRDTEVNYMMAAQRPESADD